MIRKKPALGLDPRVEAGFPKRSCSRKNRAYGCSPCASVQLQFQTATVFWGRGFGIWVVLHAPRIRMMRGPAVAMPDLVLTDVGDQAGILLVLRQGDVANALAEPRAAFSGAVAGRDDLQPATSAARQPGRDRDGRTAPAVREIQSSGNAAMLRQSESGELTACDCSRQSSSWYLHGALLGARKRLWRKGIVRLWHFATRSIITAIAIAAR